MRKRIHTSEYWGYLLAHVNLKENTEDSSPRKFMKKPKDKEGKILVTMDEIVG